MPTPYIRHPTLAGERAINATHFRKLAGDAGPRSWMTTDAVCKEGIRDSRYDAKASVTSAGRTQIAHSRRHSASPILNHDRNHDSKRFGDDGLSGRHAFASCNIKSRARLLQNPKTAARLRAVAPDDIGDCSSRSLSRALRR